ncbi:MAG: SpvB/TcaC N-terminal domain-containing protein, partial [Polyangiales bacterium]
MTRRHPFWMKLLSTVLACQVLWLTEPMVQMASAQDDPPPLPEEEVSESLPADEGGIPEDELPVDSESLDEDVPAANEEQIEQAKEALEEAATEGAGDEPPDGAEPASLPSGDEKSAVTPQAISLPDAEGSVEGMGESFAPVLSSGTATFTVPIKLPPGRAGVQPSLSLSYSSTGGNGPLGVGWGLGVPFISRQTDRGLPRYDDRDGWHEQEDRFIYNGGQELVPVDTDEMEAIDCALPEPPEGGELPPELSERPADCAPVPADVDGWQQYRARVEGAFMRFFRAPDASRWVVLGKDGTRFDFGLLPMGEGPADLDSVPAIQTEFPDGAGRIFKWCLTRMTDPHGSTVYYRYFADRGQRYLSDIFYVSPHAECGLGSGGPASRMRCDAPLSLYGRRVHLVYDERPDDFASYVSGWGVTTGLRLSRIEVTAAEGAPGERTYVRRYHLGYDPSSFHSLLSEVQVEGRPVSRPSELGVNVSDPFVSEGSLGAAKVGELLPPMRFDYSRQPASGDVIEGFGGLDSAVHEAGFSPPHSVDEGRSDLFDVNSDGLPDLVVTDPATYRTADGAPAVGVFFNGFEGEGAAPAGHPGTFSEAVPMPVPGGFSGTMTLSNLNIVPMDIDGEGRSELLHMPRFREYGYFAPTRAPDGPDSSTAPISPAEQGWRWTHVPRTVPEGFTDPRIDLTRDSPRIRVFDVNNDHLVDVVRTAGRRVQTWLNLGWLPEGDGRFGSARFNEDTGEWELSTEPTETCILHAGTPIDFADSEVKLADMNGDGIQDIVKMRRGRLVYWPGKGDAKWGVGPSECEPPGFDAGRHIEMATPPEEVNPELAGVFLSDVNADGAADIVQVRFRDVDVWFNEAGRGFTRRTTISGTPAAPDFAPRVRLTDIDGSGTTDILYGNAHRYQWIDLMGGRRPRLLTVVDNGLGALTEIDYGSSAEDYTADLADAESCTDSSCERFAWSHVESTGCQPRHEAPGDGDPATARCYRPNGSPLVSTVVRSVSTSDRFDLLGREPQVSETRFAYHDGYYEGIEQEFRGFGAADAENVGDTNHPTSFTRTFFLQGRR